jgi:hypothetical protein
VLDRIRQRFLDEPVGREVDSGRELGRLALDLHIHQ